MVRDLQEGAPPVEPRRARSRPGPGLAQLDAVVLDLQRPARGLMGTRREGPVRDETRVALVAHVDLDVGSGFCSARLARRGRVPVIVVLVRRAAGQRDQHLQRRPPLTRRDLGEGRPRRGLAREKTDRRARPRPRDVAHVDDGVLQGDREHRHVLAVHADRLPRLREEDGVRVADRAACRAGSAGWRARPPFAAEARARRDVAQRAERRPDLREHGARAERASESHAGSMPNRSCPGQTALVSGASRPHAMPALARACTRSGPAVAARISAATRPNAASRSSTQAAPSLPPKGR